MPDLIVLGWKPVPGEPCSLDCTVPDSLVKYHRGREIVLCAPHAEVLEAGKYRRTYTGALLPAESRATEWPWMPATVIDPAALAQ